MTPGERVRALSMLTGVSPLDERIAIEALTHPSYRHEHREAVAADNERLEFLGDAIVDLVVSQRLMERFPAATEGELSKFRAQVVSEEGLARVATVMRLGELLLLGRGEDMSGGRHKASVLANALEAVVGAVYLSAGLEAAFAFADRWFDASFSAVGTTHYNNGDYKTQLQELMQNIHKVAPRYRIIAESGPDHQKTFEVEVVVGERALARAAGRSKKDAEQSAAKLALEQLQTKPLGEAGYHD